MCRVILHQDLSGTVLVNTKTTHAMKRSRLSTTLYALVALAGIQTSIIRAQAPNPNFEFATGNGPIEVKPPSTWK